MFWIANTGFLFVNCQILGSRIKKSKKHYFSGTFFDHQIQVFYSWSGQILDPKLVPGTCPKIVFAKVFWQKQVKCPFTLSSCGTDRQTDTQHLTNIQNLRLLHNRPFGQSRIVIVRAKDWTIQWSKTGDSFLNSRNSFPRFYFQNGFRTALRYNFAR